MTAKRAMGLAAVCGVAFVLAYICLIVPRGAERVSPIWLPNAFVLTTLLLSRRSAWPAIAAAGGLGNLVANLIVGDAPAAALGLALCNILEYVGCAVALVKVLGRRPDMSRLINLLRYAVVAATASFGSAALAMIFLGGVASPDAFKNLFIWAMADFAGLLVVTPCLVVLGTERSLRQRFLGREAWPILGLFVVALVVFVQSRYPLLYLVPAALLLVTWRTRLAGVAAGLLGTYAIAAACTTYGLGPFSLIDGSIEERVLALQAFLAVSFYVSLPVAALADRERQLNDALSGALAEAQDEARKVRMAQAVGQLGYWRYDLRTGEVTWSDEMYRIAGRDPADPPSAETAQALIHPEDRPRCRALFQAAIARGEPYEQDMYRIETPSGLKYVSGRAIMEHDDDGDVAAAFGVLLDRTEFVRSQQAKEAAETRYRLIAERARDIIVRADLSGRVTYISPSCRSLGYEPEELLGTDGTDMLHPDDLARFQENTAQLFVPGAIDHARDRQHRFRCRDGSYVWLEGSPTVVRDESGSPVELLNVFRDVTERKAAEAELAESEARYRLLAENVSDILVRFGPDGLVRYISASCRTIGVDPEAAVGQSVLKIVAPDHLAHSQAILAGLFSGADVDTSVRRVDRIVTPDGREVWLEGSPQLVRDEAGAVVEVVTVLRDVSFRRRMEEALAESEARFRLFAEKANDLIMQTAPDGRIAYMSPSCLPLTGYRPEEVVGRSALDFVHPEDVDRLSAAFGAQVRSRGSAPLVRVEYRIRTKDGRHLWIEATPTAVVDPETGLVSTVTDVARDITERKALEEQLQAARAEAEAAAHVKSEFLANMSHELRTPLTSVLGFTKLALEQPELAPLTRIYVERVSDASRALLSAVNDILDFSKLEAGQVSFHPQPTPLSGLARAALDLFLPQAGAKDLQLVLDCHLADDQAAMLDPDRLRQVLLNLIGNAVKFTETGAITLSVGYDDAAETLQVAVRDTGPGIPADRMDRLFKRFSQVDGSLTRTGGTGLGLAICKGIVEAMGGEIGVTSAMGQGSCFAFTVPASRAQHDAGSEAGPAPETVTVNGVRVLVADDHPANRELVGLILAGMGAEVTEAEDGIAAAELAAQWPYDVILMDVRMPRLDGPGALVRIRAEPGPNDATPILAFTADADGETRERLLAAGFQGLVAKPVSPPDLVAAVALASAFADDNLPPAEVGVTTAP